MSWRIYQRICEVTAVLLMMGGIALMWMRMDPHHYLIYVGFIFLASGKLIETINVNDPGFRILKGALCISIYVLILLNLLYNIRSLVYVTIPLGLYYVLHYRLMFRQRKV
jgi:uncharacterized membrane protein HdeD (DUF308 family)